MTKNNLLLRSVASQNRVVNSEGSIFHTMIVPSNVVNLEEDVYLYQIW